MIAILRAEPEAERMAAATETGDSCRISAVNYVEAAAAIDSDRNPIASPRLDELMREAGVRIEPATEPHAGIAREAYRDFGKGSGHPAQPDFGDRFADALAQASREPLLLRGHYLQDQHRTRDRVRLMAGG